MSDYGLDERLQETANIHEQYPLIFPLTLIIFGVGILIGIGFTQIEGFGEGFYTEIVSIIITVGFIDLLNKRRDKQEQDKLQRIIAFNQIRSIERSREHNAFFEMVVRGFLRGFKVFYVNLTNFQIEGASLYRSHLQRFNLQQTKWEKIDFTKAAITESYLGKASFLKCIFHYSVIDFCEAPHAQFYDVSFSNSHLKANFRRSEFHNVKFSSTNLSGSSFWNSNFWKCNFKNCDLSNVDLQGATFSDCEFDSSTILPDGSHYNLRLNLNQLDKFIQKDSEGMRGLYGLKIPDLPLNYGD